MNRASIILMSVLLSSGAAVAAEETAMPESADKPKLPFSSETFSGI